MKKTQELMDQLKQQTSLDLEGMETMTFCQYIRQLMSSRGLTSAGLIAQAGLHRTYGYQILTGTRVPSKAKVMQLALAMKLDLHDTQNLLALSNNGSLYPKIREDAIYIHCLLHHKTVMECSILLCENGFDPLG